MDARAWSQAPAGTLVSGFTQGHVCNCIGCCRVCGQCRTTPWHAATCARVAELRREIAAVIAEARSGHRGLV